MTSEGYCEVRARLQIGRSEVTPSTTTVLSLSLFPSGRLQIGRSEVTPSATTVLSLSLFPSGRLQVRDRDELFIPIVLSRYSCSFCFSSSICASVFLAPSPTHSCQCRVLFLHSFALSMPPYFSLPVSFCLSVDLTLKALSFSSLCSGRTDRQTDRQTNRQTGGGQIERRETHHRQRTSEDLAVVADGKWTFHWQDGRNVSFACELSLNHDGGAAVRVRVLQESHRTLWPFHPTCYTSGRANWTGALRWRPFLAFAFFCDSFLPFVTSGENGLRQNPFSLVLERNGEGNCRPPIGRFPVSRSDVASSFSTFRLCQAPGPDPPMSR
jgi:hypothetical protein